MCEKGLVQRKTSPSKAQVYFFWLSQGLSPDLKRMFLQILATNKAFYLL